MHPSLRLATVLLVFVPDAASPQDGRLDLPEGFLQRVVLEADPDGPFELQLSAACYGPLGEPIVYEGGSVSRLLPEGAAVIAPFDPAVFASFLALAPSGDAVIFGESSSGDVYRIAIDASGAEVLARIPGNFAVDFAPGAALPAIRERAFVSAPAPDRNGNSIYLIDDGGLADEVARFPGFSGPLAFDDEGSLYYVTATLDPDVFPALIRLAPEQVASGIGDGAVDASEGEVLLSDLDGAFDLEWHREKLYLSNLGFNRGAGAIEVIDARRNFLHSVFANVLHGDGIASPSHLSFFPGTADFAPGAGERGGRMLVLYSDFSTFTHLVEVTPELYFLRGEVNGDGRVDISDAIRILAYLFRGGPAPEVLEAADVDADGATDITDPTYLLEYLFAGGAPPPPPFPEPGPAP